ncbi:MAG: hypothetical protein K2Y29_12100 [Beijerinckiaceae bacterium]|nr:hypothetical protein [Beijerinckiaceae bacterium]
MAVAHAQGRPSTTDMTCAQAQSTVQRAGAVLLNTGVHTFDRFVRDQAFCTPDEMTVPTWAPTRDNAVCMVGDRCESRSGRAPTPR